MIKKILINKKEPLGSFLRFNSLSGNGKIPFVMQDKYVENLDRILCEEFGSLKKEIDDKKVGVLFSAGVDSSLIAKFASDFGLNPVLYTFGTEKSKDREFVLKFTKDLKIPLVFHEVTRDEIEKNILLIKKELEKIDIDPNPMEVALAVGVYLIGKKAKEDGTQVMLCGQGSDELFAGYKKYEGLSDKELSNHLRNDIESVMAKDVARDAHMLLLSGIELLAPYTNKEFIEYSLEIPLKYKVVGETKKFIIRKVAENRGLPDYICGRPKNAMQYSSGIQKVVSKIARLDRRQSRQAKEERMKNG